MTQLSASVRKRRCVSRKTSRILFQRTCVCMVWCRVVVWLCGGAACVWVAAGRNSVPLLSGLQAPFTPTQGAYVPWPGADRSS